MLTALSGSTRTVDCARWNIWSEKFGTYVFLQNLSAKFKFHWNLIIIIIIIIIIRYLHECGPGSPVGIAIELRAGRSEIESRWGRDFRPVQTGPGAHPASCNMGTGSIPGEKCGRGVLLTTHPILVPRSWKSRAIPLPTLWATPGLQRVHFTFHLHEYPCTFTIICRCILIRMRNVSDKSCRENRDTHFVFSNFF